MLDEALALVEERGHVAFTLREVARRIGVSHAAPYRHFADKRAVMTALAAQGSDELAARIRVALAAAGDDLRVRFLAAGLAYVRFALDRRALFQVMFSGEKDPDDPRAKAAEAECFGILLAFVAEAQRAEAFPPGDPLAVATPIWAMHHGLATLAAAGSFAAHGPKGLRRVVDDAHARLLDGLMTGCSSPAALRGCRR